MKTVHYSILLLLTFCLAGCKFDGSLRYEQYSLDASKASKVKYLLIYLGLALMKKSH